MASVNKQRGGLTPFVKSLEPPKNPDEIPSSATLDDYEKIAAKMALASDEIIDMALDRMDGRTAAKEQDKEHATASSAAMPAETKVEEAKTEGGKPAEGDKKKRGRSKKADVKKADEPLDPPIHSTVAPTETKPEPQPQEGNATDGAERTASETPPAEAETPRAPHPPVDVEAMLRAELGKLRAECDDLLLRNSELEYEVSRLGAESTALKQRLERYENAHRLPRQTGTQEGYTRPQGDIPPNARRHVRLQPPRMSMNGYESWN